MTEYLKQAAVEWTVYIENNGVDDSGVLSNILGMDAVFFDRTGRNIFDGGDVKLWFGCQKQPIVKQHRHELVLYKTEYI